MDVKKTLLIVDDAPAGIRFLTDAFQTSGFDVLVATDGRQALDQIHARIPDMIISDVLMPVMDGFTLCRHLKADPLLRRIPFIFYTGQFNDQEDIRLGLSLGADLYLNKPMSFQTLLAMVHGLLDRRRSQEETGPSEPMEGSRYFEAYSQALVRKLEEQLRQLEEANQALKERDVFVQAILNSLACHIAVLDQDGRITAVNQIWTSFGVRYPDLTLPRSLPGTHYLASCRDAGSPQDSLGQDICNQIQRVVDRTTDDLSLEYSLEVVPGDTRWFMLRGTPLQGAKAGAVIAHYDITHQKRVEQYLRESETKFRALAESTSMAILIYQGTRWVYLNPAAQDISGYSREELLAMPRFWDIVHPEERETVRRLAEARQQGNVPTQCYILRIIHKSGEVRWIKITSDTIIFEGRRAGLVMLDNVTEQRRAEAALRESEERYRGYVDNAPTGICVIDAEGRCLDVNPEACRITGLSREVLVGSMVNVLFPPEHRESARDLFHALKETGRASRELPLRSLQGQTHWCLVEGIRLNPDRFLGFVTDVSDQVAARREIVRAKEQAEIASRSKSEFLANMSHEMRTPLNGILGMIQLLQISEPLPSQTEYLDAAYRSCVNLTQLLNDILDLSRIEAGMTRLVEESFTVKDILDTVVTTFDHVAREKGISLNVAQDMDAGQKFLGDPVRIRQIVFNLVGNAVKFTEQGGVTVEVARLSDVRPGQARLLFSVRDTGPGIPEDKMAVVFEAFTQLEGTYTKRHQGAGLGLSIVKRLVRLMGGTLVVDSAPGFGTTIYLSLFLKTPRPEPVVHALPSEPDDLYTHQGRILLVEDDRTNRMAVKIFLDKQGYAVDSAENGLEALERLEAKRYDLVLMDIQLPMMNGLEAIRIIRESEKFKDRSDVPIIALTAYSMTGDREKFLAAGANAYLTKPLDFEALIRTVDRLVGQPRKNQEPLA